ncbi:MAG: PDDEXK nuclease domain-containing protein [Proteobacteria bacterium]|nr:PDDEXK nuclease domain-containing protein [Pseudomonadota bacterium]
MTKKAPKKPIKKQKALVPIKSSAPSEAALFKQISTIIEKRRYRAGAYANREVTLMYWEIGGYVNSNILKNKRAEYGKNILTTLSSKLSGRYGSSFSERNLYRMSLFSERFSDLEILTMLSSKLSWSHFTELLRLKTDAARLYYANDASERNLGVHELRHQISRKAYERREIANAHITEKSAVPFNVFKDPYLLDVLGLKENYLEADLEKAILESIESFILEFGHGFTFVERQKRMIIENDEIVLDLLFFHRKLRRLVAIELKLGQFKAAYMGQMSLYLKWLNRYERQEGEEAPIGIILCTEANRGQIELLELDKAGIAVAEYWTELPPKKQFERKIKEIMQEAKERLERRKLFPKSNVQKQIDYFIEPKDEDDK